MTATFSASSLTFDGKNVELTFTYDTTTTISSDFKQLTVDIYDLSGDNGPVLLDEKTIYASDLKDFIDEFQSGDPSVPVIKHVITIDVDETVRKLMVKASENVTGANDVNFPDLNLNIPRAPSAPILENVDVTVSINGSGVQLNGSLKIIPQKGDGTSGVLLSAAGVDSNNQYFVEKLSRVPFMESNGAVSINLSDSAFDNTKIKNLKPESVVQFRARSQANDLDGNLSNLVTLEASVRLKAATITGVISFQNKKVTVNGTIPQQSGGGNTRDSLLAQLKQPNQPLDDMGWKITDAINILLISNNNGTPVTFSKEITKANSNTNNSNSNLSDLVSGAVYAFATIVHNGDLVLDKSIDVATTGAFAAPFDQSKASNIRTGVALTYLDPGTQFVAGSQTYDPLTRKLQFSPSLVTSNGTPATIPADENIVCSFAFSSEKKGLLATSQNASGNTAVPIEMYNDKDPILDDEYTVKCSVKYFLSQFLLDNVDNDPPSPLKYDNSNDGFKCIVIGDLSSTTKKGRMSEDVPKLGDLQLAVTRNAVGNKKLEASWMAEYDETFRLLSVELELMKGISGTDNSAPVQFNNLILSSSNNFPTRVSATMNGSDVADTFVFNEVGTISGIPSVFNPVLLNGLFTVRGRALVADIQNSNNVIVSSWSYASIDVNPVILNGPTFVTISAVAASSGNSFAVNFGTPSRSQIYTDSVPLSWGFNPVV